MPALVKISVALFVAGEVFIFAAVGAASWPVLVGWVVAALVVAGVAQLVRRPVSRVILAALLFPACAITVFEGGLFFVPAAAALFLAAVMDRRHHGHVVAIGR
jgi:hypothetical protein